MLSKLYEGGTKDGSADPVADDGFEKVDDGKLTTEKLKKLVKENFFSGVTVALVSIPLSAALAIASGATAMMGLSTAIWGPGIGGLIGGSNYNILGPAGALVNINSNLAAVNGIDIIPQVALWGGVMSFCVYALKLEQYCTMIPTSVLEGFSLGVATTIGLGQWCFAFGIVGLKKHKHFYMNVITGIENVDQMQMKEFLPFLVLFIILMSLLKWKPAIPWIVVIAIVGIIYGLIMDGSGDMAPTMLKDIYPKMASDVQLFSFDYWSPKKEIPFWNIVIGAAKVSFVAVLETLISGRIADNKTNTRFDQSKEIFGMSIANIVSGLLGGTPCTGVLIRTNVNIQTGATDKISQFINAVVVLLLVGLASPILVYLPMSAIAAILVTSSCRLVPKTVMRQCWEADRFEFWILIITWLICIFFDGAAGLLIGGFLSFLKLSKKTSEAQISMNVYESEVSSKKAKIMSVDIQGSLNYINVFHFENVVIDGINEKDPDFICIDLSHAIFVDIDALVALEKIFNMKKGQTSLIYDKPNDESTLTKSWWFKKVQEEGLVSASLPEARKVLIKRQSTDRKSTDSNQLA